MCIAFTFLLPLARPQGRILALAWSFTSLSSIGSSPAEGVWGVGRDAQCLSRQRQRLLDAAVRKTMDCNRAHSNTSLPVPSLPISFPSPLGQWPLQEFSTHAYCGPWTFPHQRDGLCSNAAVQLSFRPLGRKRSWQFNPLKEWCEMPNWRNLWGVLGFHCGIKCDTILRANPFTHLWIQQVA